MENKTRNSWWSLIIILPLLWGFFGLIQGKGFFPYIIENIKALTIIGIGLLALTGFSYFIHKK